MFIPAAHIIKHYGLSLSLILALGLTAALPVYASSQVVGHISFVKGNNAAQQPEAAPR